MSQTKRSTTSLQASVPDIDSDHSRLTDGARLPTGGGVGSVISYSETLIDTRVF